MILVSKILSKQQKRSQKLVYILRSKPTIRSCIMITLIRKKVNIFFILYALFHLFMLYISFIFKKHGNTVKAKRSKTKNKKIFMLRALPQSSSALAPPRESSAPVSPERAIDTCFLSARASFAQFSAYINKIPTNRYGMWGFFIIVIFRLGATDIDCYGFLLNITKYSFDYII